MMHMKYTRSHRFQRKISFRYPRHDSPVAASAKTVWRLARHFRISHEALILIALRGLANEVWPIDELEESFELNHPSETTGMESGVLPFDEFASLLNERGGLF